MVADEFPVAHGGEVLEAVPLDRCDVDQRKVRQEVCCFVQRPEVSKGGVNGGREF